MSLLLLVLNVPKNLMICAASSSPMMKMRTYAVLFRLHKNATSEEGELSDAFVCGHATGNGTRKCA